MRGKTIKDLGTINIEKIEVCNGQLEIFIPVEVISDELETVLDRLTEDFERKHPEVKSVAYNVNLIFSFGFENPEFSMSILVFDENTQDAMEEYDHFFVGSDIELSADQKKQIKKIIWDKLGETLLDL